MNPIRLDGDTDHDGKVIAASSAMSIDGRFAARKGDKDIHSVTVQGTPVRRIFTFLMVLCLARAAYAAELIAAIESRDLGSVSEELNGALSTDTSFRALIPLHCVTQGKQVTLSTADTKTIWFVTTANACGWGAALGPIWLVQVDSSGKPSLILSSGGYSLYASKKIHHGLSDVVIDSGTAGEGSSKRYVFNGQRYKLSDK
jgi:hypothetical protein